MLRLGRQHVAHVARFQLRQLTTSVVCASNEGPEPSYATDGVLSGFKTFHNREAFHLRGGGVIKELELAYETWGTLRPGKDNAILLQCGMSASSHAASNSANPAAGWWEKFIGPGLPLDTNLFFIVCSNNLGGCSGSTGKF